MTKPLTERDYEVLRELRAYERSPYRNSRGAHPMDVGGYNGSHHSGTLNKLVRHGLVSRSYPPRAGHRGSQRYKLTEKGMRVTEEHIAQYMAELRATK
jgi:DNA-binding MarR family transcriptional regulator